MYFWRVFFFCLHQNKFLAYGDCAFSIPGLWPACLPQLLALGVIFYWKGKWTFPPLCILSEGVKCIWEGESWYHLKVVEIEQDVNHPLFVRVNLAFDAQLGWNQGICQQFRKLKGVPQPWGSIMGFALADLGADVASGLCVLRWVCWFSISSGMMGPVAHAWLIPEADGGSDFSSHSASKTRTRGWTKETFFPWPEMWCLQIIVGLFIFSIFFWIPVLSNCK